MTDDGADYEYTYDAFGRLVLVEMRGTSNVVQRYRYNGLGQRIGWQFDTDADGTVETSGTDDPWTYALYNDRWQLIGEHTADDGTSGAGAADDPDRLFVHHGAGLGGSGGSSYLDSVIMADDDTDASAESCRTAKDKGGAMGTSIPHQLIPDTARTHRDSPDKPPRVRRP